MKKIMKKIWACLLACTMVVTMLPGLTLKVKADVTKYDLRVGDTEVTSEHLSGTGWSYDDKNETLTLNGFNCELSKAGSGVIESNRSTLKIVLMGENRIENTSNATSSWNVGLRSGGTLTISGDGSLTTYGGTGYTSHGISANNLIIDGGTITAIGQNAQGSSGIYARGDITINKGTVTAKAETSTSGTSRGIECIGRFTLGGGFVNATAKQASNSSYGLQTKEMELKAGKMSLEGQSAAYSLNGRNSSKTSYEFPEKASLTANNFIFTAPNELIYDGKEKTATVTAKNENSTGEITVKYYDEDGKLLQGVPKEVGTYTVKVDVSENDTYKAVTGLTDSMWKFTISYGTVTTDMYKTSGINDKNWAKDTVTVDAKAGYIIAKTPSASFDTSIVFSENDTNREFYIKETSTGKVYKGSLSYQLDTTKPVITGISDGKTYCKSVDFTVTDTGSRLADVKDGNQSLGNSGRYRLTTPGKHVITATDVAGNENTVTVTVNSEHTISKSKVSYVWNSDYSECTATATCDNCGEQVTETKSSTNKITTKQTCTEPEKTTYTVEFTTNSEFETQNKVVQTKEALGHTPNEDDGDCTTAITCKRCDHVFTGAKEHDFSGEWQKDETGHWKECNNAGCTKIGNKKAHTPNISQATEDEDQVCTECGWVIANKLGHIHKFHLEFVEAKEATCTEAGNKAYYQCSEDQTCFADENAEKQMNASDIKIEPSGHEYADPVYTWSEDNKTCTATISCKKCKNNEKEVVETTSKVTQKQSSTKPEITTYTATFTNKAFAAQSKEVQTKDVAKQKADGNKINAKANSITLNSEFSIKTGKSIKITWAKVKDADGYDVYVTYCGQDKFALVKSTKASSVTISKLMKKAIDQKNNVKCYVVAYKKINGKKQEIGKSKVFHAVGKKNKSETEPKNIKLKKTSYVLKAGKTATIKALIVKKNKKLPVIKHTDKFRYATSNAKVAEVSKDGKITAKKKGTCYVYVYAVNGCAKKVKVTVK